MLLNNSTLKEDQLLQLTLLIKKSNTQIKNTYSKYGIQQAKKSMQSLLKVITKKHME